MRLHACFYSQTGKHPPKVHEEHSKEEKTRYEAVDIQSSGVGFVSAAVEVGKAARMFRIKPSYFARLTAEPWKSARYCSTVRPRQSSRDMAAKAAEE